MKTMRRIAAAAALALISATSHMGDFCGARTNPASPYNATSTGGSNGNSLRAGGLHLFENGGATNVTHGGTLTLLGNVELGPVSFIPEPSSVALLSASFAGLAGLGRRSSKT
jgi:hypothetical protein